MSGPPCLPLSVLLSPVAKILGKVGESLSRICCVRPPVERFTFVGKGAAPLFFSSSYFDDWMSIFKDGKFKEKSQSSKLISVKFVFP